MKKLATILVALGLVAGLSLVAPANALAQDHMVQVLNMDGQPQPGVQLWISILTAPNAWTSSGTLTTYEGRMVHFDRLAHSTAIYWKATIQPTVTPFNPPAYYWEVDYQTFGFDVEWIIQ